MRERASGAALEVALSIAVVLSFVVIGFVFTINRSDAARQRQEVCQAAKENRQLLRDLVALTRPDFRRRAQALVDKKLACES